MPGVLVERNDAVEVYAAAGAAIARARRGEGPTLIEVKTDRYFGHFQGDPETYRPKGESAALRQDDPIVRLGARLRAEGLIDEAQDRDLRMKLSARVESAFAFGRNSPYPAPQDALKHVFAE
jgi:pyruvate dehydrogenase E1 component alpha subunit